MGFDAVNDFEILSMSEALQSRLHVHLDRHLYPVPSGLLDQASVYAVVTGNVLVHPLGVVYMRPVALLLHDPHVQPRSRRDHHGIAREAVGLGGLEVVSGRSVVVGEQ